LAQCSRWDDGRRCPAPAGKGTERDLERFLREFKELAAIYGEKAAALTPDVDSRPLVDHYTRVTQEQIDILSRQMMATYESASEELRAEVDQMLEMSAGVSLAAGAKGPMRGLRSVGAFAAAGPVLKLIKKIIRLLGEALGFTLPGVIDKFLELLDELFGEQAGAVSDAAAERSHRSEIRYMEAQYHLTRLVQLREGSNDREERNGA
jgi:hypothetical protein